MTNMSVFAFVIIAAVWYVTPINTAAIDSENPTARLERMILGLNRRDRLHLRSALIEEGETPRPCYDDPCGYTVYAPIKRDFLFYISRPCYCPETYKCVRTDEDSLSENSFVHRCRPNDTFDPNAELPDWFPRY